MTHYAKRLYPAVDAADKESCRPDFAVPIYPGHLSLSAAEWDAKQGTKKFIVPHPPNADKHLSLNPEIPVTSQTPPTFLLQAEDDHVDNVADSLAYYIALKKEDNAARIRASLNMSSSEELSIKMAFEDDGSWLYVPSRQAKLSLTFQQ